MQRAKSKRRYWRCRRCNSTRVSAAFDYGSTVERIDQSNEDAVEPRTIGAEVAGVSRVFCDACGHEWPVDAVDPRTVLARR